MNEVHGNQPTSYVSYFRRIPIFNLFCRLRVQRYNIYPKKQ